MTTTVIPTVLNRENYEDWSFRMKTYFLAEDLWDIVEGTVKEPPEAEEKKAWKKKDAKALYAIHNSCGDDTYPLIKYITSAAFAWTVLSINLKRDKIPPDESGTTANKTVGEAYPNTPESALEEGLSVTGADKTVGEAHPNRRESTLEEGLNVSGGRDESGETADTPEHNFVKYMESNDWDNAINFLRQHPRLGSYRLQDAFGGTALHYAIQKRCSVRIIQQLVELMPDALDSNALYYLVTRFPEGVQVAECMFKKNPDLLTTLRSLNVGYLVVRAQRATEGERMARCLYSHIPPETIQIKDAAQLISEGFRLQRFDIAWDFIQRYPQLAMAIDQDGEFPLVALASNRFAFKSGSRFSLWEKLIYDGIRIKPLPSINKDSPRYVYQDPLAEQNENQRHHLISSGLSLFRRLVANLRTLLGINRIYQIKLMHERVQQILPRMCESVTNMSPYQERKWREALCVAAERGHVEYINHFLRSSPYHILYVVNEKFQNLFQIAAECRHYNVYNIICEFLRKPDKDGLDKSDYDRHSDKLKKNVEHKDKLGNNMLHTVARITSLSQIDHIQGATLQMQRELQWFKEVESIVEAKDCEFVNNDNKTPQKVFKENHKELGKEAEKSMKETATSCTVVGALIVTIMFAAAFTVLGENDKNDEKTDLPIFLTNKVFTTFIVSDAISLFASTTSVIMFLGILTSRYSEDDFYKSLPTKMIIGLFTLFLSIATMMIVFSSGLYIMLDGKSSIVIPSILLASVPITSFIWMQFPLLVELFISTFGQGVFDRK